MPRRIGVIDIGSNTTSLAIYNVGPGPSVDRIAQRGEALRLIRTLTPERAFPPAAMERTLQTLRGFVRFAQDVDTDRLHAVATSAVRDAANGAALIERIRADLKISAEILSGEDEGRASALAVVNTLPFTDGFAVDMGGGSLQITEFRGRHVQRAVSLPLGVVRLYDSFFRNDPPGGTEITALRRHVQAAVAPLDWFRAAPGLTLVGVGGTIRALAKVDRKSRQWPITHGHGYRLEHDTVEAIFETTSRMPVEKRRDIPGLASHRVDGVAVGAEVVSLLMRASGFDALRVCHYGVREGTALRVLQGQDEPLLVDVQQAGLGFCLGAELERGQRAARLAGHLFDLLISAPDTPRRALLLATALAAVARVDGARLLEVPISGFTQEDVLGALDLLQPGRHRQLVAAQQDRLRVLLDVAVYAAPNETARRVGDVLHLGVRLPDALSARLKATFGVGS